MGIVVAGDVAGGAAGMPTAARADEYSPAKEYSVPTAGGSAS
ncbi:MAG: hypothetical protein R6V28_16200 [Nitriliruptoraceae bacterium]